MKKKYITLLAIMFMVMISGCEKSEDECGEGKVEAIVLYGQDLFLQPSEIYWGVTGNTRSYTYNWTFANNCTKSNPKVSFIAEFDVSNNTLPNPFTIDAGTTTCFGVQPHTAILLPDPDHQTYESSDSEIGMQQCFGGQNAATIYPFITFSFTTFGSSEADSLYLVDHLYFIKATREYKLPK
jgi:hypothetical protein